MKKTFAVCELEENISEIIRLMREREVIEITEGGEAIALLMPLLQPHPSFERPEGDIWADMDRLAAEVSARWPEDVSAVDAIRDMRREL